MINQDKILNSNTYDTIDVIDIKIKKNTNNEIDEVVDIDEEIEKQEDIINSLIANFKYCKTLDRYYEIENNQLIDITPKSIKMRIYNKIHQKLQNANNNETKVMLNNIKKVAFNDLIKTKNTISLKEIELAPNLILTQNKMLNLNNVRDDFISNNLTPFTTNCNYNPDAKAPLWEKFIDEISNNNKEFAEYLQKVVGYWLYGNNIEQCAFFLTGTGANGKTVFIETIKKVLGSFALVGDKSIILKDNARTLKEYVNIVGRKIIIINELDDLAQIKIDVFKRLTGLDTIRVKYEKDYLDFTNKAKLVIVSNTLPDLGYSTGATWRRIRVLPFDNEFKNENRNLFLIDELEQEFEGILNWMIEGYQKWLQSKCLEEPKMLQERMEYLKSLVDPLGGFFVKCIMSPEKTISSVEFYQRYVEYCQYNQIPFVNKHKFAIILSAKGIERYRDNRGLRCYKGITFNREQYYFRDD